jgi:hypothetical protein
MIAPPVKGLSRSQVFQGWALGISAWCEKYERARVMIGEVSYRWTLVSHASHTWKIQRTIAVAASLRDKMGQVPVDRGKSSMVRSSYLMKKLGEKR